MDRPLFDGRLNVLAPQALVDAVQKISARNLQSVNSYTRQALLEALRKDGVKLERENAA